MDRSFVLKTGIYAVAMVLGTVVPAAAQVVVIKKGAIIVPTRFPGLEAATIELSGTRGFSFVGGATGWGFSAMTECEEGCLPGSMLSLDAFFGGSDLGGTARLQGTTYVDIGSFSSTENLVLLTTGRVTLPAISDEPVSVTAPFDFAGQFSYVKNEEPGSVLLTGGGIATLFLQLTPDGMSWIVAAAEFEFRPARQ
jgi:hypothetical protein